MGIEVIDKFKQKNNETFKILDIEDVEYDGTDAKSKIEELINNVSNSTVSIAGVEKTATVGLVDTYTIMYTNDETSTFNVTNGDEGKGILSVKKTNTENNIDTYTITYSDGTFSTYQVINGQDGARGSNVELRKYNKMLQWKSELDSQWRDLMPLSDLKGENGTSVRILGSFNSVEELIQAHPSGNQNGDGYIINGDLYIWDGISFINVGRIQGTDGIDGTNGVNGTSIIWKGEFDKHPENPRNGWAYYNTVEKKSFIYQDSAWYQMTVDGTDGQDGNNGLSIVWKGELPSPPLNPKLNWAYRDTNNRRIYIYNGLAWELMVLDGSDGADGAPGQDGLSVFITYHDSVTPPSKPIGNGTTGGWHTEATHSSIWMSQKVALNSTEGEWGNPIKIKGSDGVDGTDGIAGEDGTSIVWKGSFPVHPLNPQNGWAYYNTTDKKSYVYQDNTWYQMTIDGTNGQNGTDGLSIVWKGELSSPPENPLLNWAYKDKENKKIYIYNGNAWELMVLDGSDGADGAPGQDGLSVFITYNDNINIPDKPTGDGTLGGWHTNATKSSIWMSQKVALNAIEGQWGDPIKIKGDNGSDGSDGADGTSIIWKGSFSSHPENPQNGWAYYNTTEKKSFVYQDNSWYQMTIDGTDGQDGSDGISIVWKGELSSPPENPKLNWAYKDSNNGYIYIYNGTAWELMVLDGSDGADGAPGQDGLSVFIVYNDNIIEPNKPTGNGTTDGWHSNATKSSIWMSQKVALSDIDGTWGDPIKIKGDNGINGSDGVDGADGTSIVWKGTLIKHPENPQNGWAYYNSIEKKSFIYQDNTWYQMTIDGTNGQNGSDGLSIVWKGEISSPPDNPKLNWAYKDKENGNIYIYNGLAWELMVLDGNDGVDGSPGQDGLSVFITYHDGKVEPTKPTGDGTLGGWHTSATNSSIWMSQKVASTPIDGTWGNPIKIKGDDGVDGIPGKDGTSVRILGSFNSIEELIQAHPSGNENGDGYIINGDLHVWDGTTFINVGKIRGDDGKSTYLHIKYSNDGSTFTPNSGEDSGKFIGILINNIEEDSMKFSDYKWQLIVGQDGLDGIQGPKGEQGIPGKDGKVFYTWIKYADDDQGNGMSDYSTGKLYIGIAYNKETETESTVATDYTWSKFRGDQGIQGETGANGVTYYTWIKYADDDQGNGMSDNPEGKSFMGIAYNKESEIESINPKFYLWSKIKGDKGDQGIQGETGADGKTYYTWIKYADDANGTGMGNEPEGKLYIGIAYNKPNQTESNIASDYTWSLIKGEQGNQGIQGETGADGKTYYTWIKYADDIEGNGMSDDPANKDYIGLACNKETNVPSSNKIDYIWSKYKGEQGIPGANGVTYYTWIKYADDDKGTGINDSPIGKEYIGMAYNKLTSEESSNPDDYTWSKFKGDQGVEGPKGPSGITYYTWIKYADDIEGNGMSDSPVGKSYIGIAYNKPTSTESTIKTDYTWAKIQGDNGINGTDGTSYYTWIKYADDIEGNGISDDATNKQYIGIAHNQLNPIESSNSSDYTWSKFRGDQGIQGPSGVTYYTWIKYADDVNGNGMSDYPDNKEYIGMAYNKPTDVESIDPKLYTWSKFKGEQGIPGEAGIDGKTQYTWIKYADDEYGSGMSDDPAGKYYMGIAYNKPTSTESSSVLDYTWTRIKGDQGVQGEAGDDGLTYYTWIKYADDIEGNGMSDDPTGKEYIGMAYNKLSLKPSLIKTDYTWSKYKGDQGVQGRPGLPGQTYYTWIKYADDEHGNGMSDDPTSKFYMGIAYNKSTPSESNTPSDYSWSKFRGDKGDQGVQGPTGSDGKTQYTWIKYADDNKGNGMSNNPENKLYMGIAYNKLTETESETPSDYNWSLIKGEQGIEGPKGDSGQTYYTWIKYADDENGTGISDHPSGKSYIGLAYNKLNADESMNPVDYIWSKIKGEQGNQGVQGEPGADGITYYTWIKYADNIAGGGLSDIATGKSYIGLAYNKLSAQESENPADYKWSKYKGDQGVPGNDGLTFYTWVKYANDENGTGLSDNPAGKTYIGLAYNKPTPDESLNASDYTWGKFKGDQGVQGETGSDGVTHYTWIKYADDASGTNMSDDPTGKLYIGMAYNKLVQQESNIKSDYTWSRFKGEQGVPGSNGTNGVTYYTWIKYADDENGTGMSDEPYNKTYIGMAYNRITSTESTDFRDYKWSKIKGDQGNQGIQGETGNDGTTYYTWIKYANDNKGYGMSDNPEGKDYIGLAYNKLIPEESTNASDYTWSKFKGDQGDQGVQGIQGIPGVTYYTWIKYADDNQGNGMSDNPDGKLFMGIAYNKLSVSESLNPSDYTWSKYIGDQGIKGADGTTYYTWIKYADDENGTGMVDDPTGKEYIGIAYNKTSQTESNVASDYTWSKFKGEQGIPGESGTDAITHYTWIKYANDVNGVGMSDDPTGKEYIGIAYNKLSMSESNVASDYTWSKFRGDKGNQGVQGESGKDGVTYYTWIKYANDVNGIGMSDLPDGKEYMGIAYNKTTPVESNIASDYTWSKFKGDQGIQGSQGVPGQTYYTWIKYANDASGTVMSDLPDGKTYIGLAHNKTTAVESNIASDYTWSKFKGDQGIQGIPGSNGVTYYTWIKYADNASGSGMSDLPEGKAYIGIAYNKTSQTESTNASDYSWSKIKGDQGIAGQTYYTWIKYADNASGSGMSDLPDGKTYIGLAHNKTTAVESTTPTDYTWSKFKGDQGVPGQSGSDGVTYYTWIKYANDVNGTGISDDPTGKEYIGMAYNKTSKIESTTPTDYTWSKFRGDKGDQGIQGPSGSNGKTSYFHIKYSNDNGVTFTSNNGETIGTYIGTYVDYEPTDSSSVSAYTWARFQGIQGPKGEQGIPGVNGATGATTYLHIKYSNDNGVTFTSNNGETVGTYIGTYTDTNINDSSSVSAYTWAKIKGEDGKDVVSIVFQYCINTSNITPPVQGDVGWSTTKPDYVSGKYLWERVKQTYANPSSTVYTTPVLDTGWAEFEDVYSSINEANGKIKLLIGNSTSESNLTLTPNMISLLSKNLVLSGDRINITGATTITGMVTANSNFIINTDGSITCKSGTFSGTVKAGKIESSTFNGINDSFNVSADGSVEAKDIYINGEASVDALSVNVINNTRYQQVLDSDIEIFLDQTILESATECVDGAIFNNLDDLESVIPRNLNGYTVFINLLSDYTGNLNFSFFNSGTCYIYINKKTIRGYLSCFGPSMRYAVYGNKRGEEGGDTNYGIIMPNSGRLMSSYRYGVIGDYTTLTLYDLKIYAGKATDYKNCAIICTNLSTAYLNNIAFVNKPWIGVRTHSCAHLYCSGSSGITESNSFSAVSGSIQFLNTGQQAGRESGNVTYTSGNAQIFSTGVEFTNSGLSGDNTTTPPPAVEVKTVTVKANYGDSYRKTVYNSWKKDGTVRQGDYGYGDCVGCWFFGSNISNYKSKDITKVVITIKRNSGGINAAVPHKLRMHNYSSRPSGAPSFSGISRSFDLAVGNSINITLTSSTDIAAFKACKGFGLDPGSYSSGNYSVCSGTMTVKITYNE